MNIQSKLTQNQRDFSVYKIYIFIKQPTNVMAKGKGTSKCRLVLPSINDVME